MGRFLDMIRERTEPNAQTAAAKEAKHAKKGTDGSELETRLDRIGISIAIDRATNRALLIFNEAGATAVRKVATVYNPFEVALTDAQRRELATDLDSYERLLAQKRRTA